MAKDYTIRFTGQDDLSNTINKVKNELKDVGSSTVNIDKIEQKFKRIESSTAPLKRKLKDLQGIMAQMNLDGLSNTDQFTRMAEQAGKYKDAISDAKQATSNFANDTFKLEAGIQAFEGVAGAASIAAGVMGIFGGENKKVQQSILQVQSALNILNGIQAFTNVLNKDSTLMLRLKSIWAAASATATTADAVAEGVDTVAVGANTIALKAWNIAKAVGKALLGDWTGLVLVGAVALGTYALATNNSTDAEQEHTKALNESSNAANTYKNKYNETATSLITNYKQLRAEWQQLSTAQEKSQWIKDNQTKFDELGISVLNTRDAENIFVNNTSSVINALKNRAKEAAAAALAQERYQQALEASLNKKSVTKFRTYKTGQQVGSDVISKNNLGAGDYKSTSSNIGNGGVHTDYILTKSGAAKLTNISKQGALQTARAYNAGIDAQVKTLENQGDQSMNQSVNYGNQANKTLGGKSNNKSSNTHKSNTPKSNTPKPKDNNEENKRIEEQNRLLEKQQQDLNQIDELQMQAARDFNASNTNEYEQKITEINLDLVDSLNRIEEQKNKAFKDFGGNIPEKLSKSFDDAEMAAIAKAKKLREDIEKNANPTIKIKADTEQKPEKKERKIDKTIKDWNSIEGGFEGINGAVDSMKTLITSINEGKNAWDVFLNSMRLVSSILEGVQSAMDAVNTIQTLLNVTTAEGAATDTAATATELADAHAKVAANTATAATGAAASVASIPVVGWILAGVAVAGILALLASVGSFADGGVIGGNSYHGDGLLANVNAGEMILNTKQQSNLFKMLDGANGNTSTNGVTFKIQGKELVGVLNNYNSKMNKVR